MKKVRVLSFVLSVLLVVNAFPLNIFAEGVNDGDNTPVVTEDDTEEELENPDLDEETPSSPNEEENENGTPNPQNRPPVPETPGEEGGEGQGSVEGDEEGNDDDAPEFVEDVSFLIAGSDGKYVDLDEFDEDNVKYANDEYRYYSGKKVSIKSDDEELTKIVVVDDDSEFEPMDKLVIDENGIYTFYFTNEDGSKVSYLPKTSKNEQKGSLETIGFKLDQKYPVIDKSDVSVAYVKTGEKKHTEYFWGIIPYQVTEYDYYDIKISVTCAEDTDFVKDCLWDFVPSMLIHENGQTDSKVSLSGPSRSLDGEKAVFVYKNISEMKKDWIMSFSLNIKEDEKNEVELISVNDKLNPGKDRIVIKDKDGKEVSNEDICLVELGKAVDAKLLKEDGSENTGKKVKFEICKEYYDKPDADGVYHKYDLSRFNINKGEIEFNGLTSVCVYAYVEGDSATEKRCVILQSVIPPSNKFMINGVTHSEFMNSVYIDPKNKKKWVNEESLKITPPAGGIYDTICVCDKEMTLLKQYSDEFEIAKNDTEIYYIYFYSSSMKVYSFTTATATATSDGVYQVGGWNRDITAPMPEDIQLVFNSRTKGAENQGIEFYGAEIEVTVESTNGGPIDAGSGVREVVYRYKELNNSWSSKTVTVEESNAKEIAFALGNGFYGDFQVQIIDNVGNSVLINANKNFWIDDTKPTVTASIQEMIKREWGGYDYNSYKSGEWTKNPLKFNLDCSDAPSGINHYEYCISTSDGEEETNGTWIGLPYGQKEFTIGETEETNINYGVYVRGVSNCGVVGEGKFYEVKLWQSAPTVPTYEETGDKSTTGWFYNADGVYDENDKVEISISQTKGDDKLSPAIKNMHVKIYDVTQAYNDEYGKKQFNKELGEEEDISKLKDDEDGVEASADDDTESEPEPDEHNHNHNGQTGSNVQGYGNTNRVSAAIEALVYENDIQTYLNSIDTSTGYTPHILLTEDGVFTFTDTITDDKVFIYESWSEDTAGNESEREYHLVKVDFHSPTDLIYEILNGDEFLTREKALNSPFAVSDDNQEETNEDNQEDPDDSSDGLADTAAELKYEHYYGDAVVVKADADCGISGKGEMYLVYWPEDTEFDPYKILQIVQEEIAKYQPADTNGEGQLQDAIKIIPSEPNKYQSTEVEFDDPQSGIVFAYIIDGAGNVSYGWTNGIITESSNPGDVKISVTNQNSKGFINKNFDAMVDVIDLPDASFSGVVSVVLKVVGNGSESVRTLLTNNQNVTLDELLNSKEYKNLKTSEMIDAKSHESNEAYVEVTVKDRAGNSCTSNLPIMIDMTKPVISVGFNNNSPMNGKYYKDNRTATITIKEKNFDPSQVSIKATKNGAAYTISGLSWNNSGDVHTANITFAEDGNYAFSVDCIDKADNKADQVSVSEFVIDKTKPEYTIAYNNNDVRNGMYYNSGRIATITVTEHNFDESTYVISSDDGIVKEGWTHAGDVHTTHITFNHDGQYEYNISIGDLAGNVSDPAENQVFVVDTVYPEVKVTEGKGGKALATDSAHKKIFTPVVTVTDAYINEGKVKFSVKNQDGKTFEVKPSLEKQGTTYTYSLNGLSNLEDGIYTLSVVGADLADNTTPVEIRYSVNQHGSTFELSNETRALIEAKAVTKNGVPNLVVTEWNWNEITKYKFTISKNGKQYDVQKIVECSSYPGNPDSDTIYYSVKSSGDKAKGFKNIYTFYSGNFGDDGFYNIVVNSEDYAGNSVLSTKDVKNTISFYVDNTAPEFYIDGINDGDRKAENEIVINLRVTDMNLAKALFTLSTKDGIVAEYDYLDLIAKMQESDSTVMLGDTVTIVLPSSDKKLTLDYDIEDMAGNVRNSKLSEENVPMSFFVTTNRWILFVNNKPLLFGSIAGVSGLAAAGIGFSIRRKRRFR